MSGMSSLRPASSRASGPSGAGRSTAGSGAGRLGAPGRGSVGVVGQGHAGVVGVPRVRVGLEGGHSMVVVAAGVCAGFHPLIAVGTATPWRRGLSRRCPGLRRRDGELSERRGLYRRWYLGSGSPSDSEVTVRSTCSSGSRWGQCFCPRPPRWVLRAGYSLSGAGT